MNEPNSQPPERRYGEKRVLLQHGNDTLHGTQYALYPVDEPPLIEVGSVSRRWYRSVWQDRGWEVTGE